MLFGFSRHCTRSDLVPRRNPYTAMPVPHFTKNYSNNDKRHQTFKVFIEQNNKPIKKNTWNIWWRKSDLAWISAHMSTNAMCWKSKRYLIWRVGVCPECLVRQRHFRRRLKIAARGDNMGVSAASPLRKVQCLCAGLVFAQRQIYILFQITSLLVLIKKSVTQSSSQRKENLKLYIQPTKTSTFIKKFRNQYLWLNNRNVGNHIWWSSFQVHDCQSHQRFQFINTLAWFVFFLQYSAIFYLSIEPFKPTFLFYAINKNIKLSWYSLKSDWWKCKN